MVARQTLTLFVRVRILLRLPTEKPEIFGFQAFYIAENAPTVRAFSIQRLCIQQNSAGAFIPIDTKVQRFPQIAQLEVVVPIDLKRGQ